MISNIEKEKSKKARYKMFKQIKSASFPQSVKPIYPEVTHFKLADKKIAIIAKSLGVKPGKYVDNLAKQNLNKLRNSIVRLINKSINEYDFNINLPYLIEKSDAVINELDLGKSQLKASLDHEVDFNRDETYSENYIKFLHWHKVFRYIIEKFICLKPSSPKRLTEKELKNLLALADRLHDVYAASDLIHYNLFSTNLLIDRDYLTSVEYAVDLEKMEKESILEYSRIELGELGNKNDAIDNKDYNAKYLNQLDSAFKKDFDFGLKNMINLQQVMGLWADYSQCQDKPYYIASPTEISSLCSKNITDFDNTETSAILNFLTLRPEKILYHLDEHGKEVKAVDIPVWEYNKRINRYTIKPLVRMGDKYIWGPCTVERSAQIWASITSKHRLPANFNAPTIKSVLKRGHERLEKNLERKVTEIVSRHTINIKPNIFPHKYIDGINDIGDIDVFALLKEPNILLNIESKIIDLPYCYKDSARVQRKIFINETKNNEIIKKSYVQRIQEREEFLKIQGKQLIEKIGWDCNYDNIRIVSIFVTKIGFWWTKHPPIQTNIDFVEIRMLDDFLKNLKNSS